MNQSLLEPERINERFQCRSRGAWTTRSVDLTVNVGLVEICGANLRNYVHRPGINQKNRCVFDAATAIIRDVIGYPSFNRSLLFQIKCGDDLVAALRPLEHFLDKMRREEFSLCLHARPKFAHRKFRVVVDASAIIPTGLRE